MNSAVVNQIIAFAKAGRHRDMEAKARELTVADPEAGFAWKALGAALQLQGKDALVALRRAAELAPRDAETQSNLGSELRRHGRLEEAVGCLREALRLKPALAEVWNNLGNVLRDLGEPAGAIEAFERALASKPGLTRAHYNLGNVLNDIGRLEEAESSYRRALECEPHFLDACVSLGSLLRIAGRRAEAEVECARALDAAPDTPAALILMAELRSDRGDFAAAERFLRRAIAARPDDAPAWAGLARLRRMTRADEAWLREAQRLAASRRQPREEIPLRYALGKYFDDVGEYEAAFAEFATANELAKRLRPPHDRRAVSAAVDRIIATFDRDWLARNLSAAAAADPRPILVVGMPRSGTTLVERILASIEGVHGAGELPYWNRAAADHAARRADGEAEADLLAALAGGYRALLAQLAPAARQVVDKMPGNFLYLGLIHAALPGARIVHVHRNPLDTCLSIYTQDFGPAHSYANDLGDLAHYYREYSRLMAHWRASLPAAALLEVRYETLVAEPESTARRLLDFVGAAWDPRCLEPAAEKHGISTFSKWQARQPIGTGSVERWRRYEQFLAPLRGLLDAEPRIA